MKTEQIQAGGVDDGAWNNNDDDDDGADVDDGEGRQTETMRGGRENLQL